MNKVKKILSTDNAPHYKWGGDSDGWHLLQNPELSVIQEHMPPGECETLHHHENAQQLFYILFGEATFQIERQTLVLTASQSIHIPSGVSHQIRNNGSESIHFLVISNPHAHGDRILD